jgi:hypothetical protein
VWADLDPNAGLQVVFSTRCGILATGGGNIYASLFEGCDGEAPRRYAGPPVAMTDGWHHIALVYPDLTSVEIYLDGALVATSALAEDLASNEIAGAFGAVDDVTLGAQSLFSDVSLAEARVSGSARYVAPFVPEPDFAVDADTLALYDFREGSGTIVGDRGPLALDGTILGGATWASFCYQP